jgi:MFS family permease
MRKEWVAVLLANMLVSMGMGMITPVYLLYISQKLKSIDIIFNSYGIFALFLGFFELLAGYLSDKFGANKILVMGISIGALTSLGYMVANSATQVYLLEIFSALSTSLQTPALNSLISKLSKEGSRGKFFGLFNSFANIFYGIAAIVSGVIFSYFTINTLFFTSFALQAFSAFILSKTGLKPQ